MGDTRCLLCYNNNFETHNNKKYCCFCGAEVPQLWSLMNPELIKIFMKNFHKDFNWGDKEIVAKLPALAEYLKEINSQDEEEEVPLRLKNCLSCKSDNLKPYQGKAFCLKCAMICEDRENDNINEEAR